MKITNVKVSEIKGYEKNNKIHGEKQIKLLSETIQKYGFTNPIILNKDNVIIGGHGRLKSVKQLGWDEVPCVYVENLSEEDERKLRLLDNKIAELAEDNLEAIKFELDELQDMELNELYDLDIEIIEDKEEIEDDVPDIQENIIVEKGDIFQLGSHRLMCGDSTSIEDVEKLMNGEKADLIHTDPPYNVNAESRSKKGIDKILNDNMDDDSFQIFINKVFINLKLFLKEKGVYYIWHNHKCQYIFEEEIEKCGFNITSQIIWKKDIPSYSDNLYRQQHEICFYCRNKEFIDYGFKSETVWDIPSIQSAQSVGDDGKKWFQGGSKTLNLHVTQKPIQIPETAITHSSKKGDKVLDLFGGSGSTLIASEKTNRKCYMMELDEKYIQVILKRYYDYTEGKKEIKCLNRNLNLTPILNPNK